MRLDFKLLFVLFLLCGFAHSAEAQWQGSASAPKLSMEGSLQLPWTDNAFYAPERKSAFFGNPDFKLNIGGNLQPGWDYDVYARASAVTHYKEIDANDSASLLGGRLKHSIFGWNTRAIYEFRQFYNKVFETLAFNTHDFKAAALKKIVDCLPGLTCTPFLQAHFRHSDNLDVRRFGFDASLDLERALQGKWSHVGTLEFGTTAYIDGVNSGRRDVILGVGTGLKYSFNDDISLTTAVHYEQRFSNVSGKEYKRWDIGPKLDFAF